MSKLTTKILITGTQHRIEALVENGKCQVTDFIDSRSEAEQKKLVALLKFSAEYGPPKNEQKFKKLNDEHLFEFKGHQSRIFCTFDKNKIIILAYGFVKKGNKTPKGEITKAKSLLDRYFKER